MYKIMKYKKKNNNMYEITLSNGKYDIYDDVILKYNLLLKKEINDNELNEIIEYNKYYTCYYKAISLINIKLRTEKELINKLNDFDKNSIDFTITKLKENNYLNEDLYINSYINDQINLKLIGQNKIISDLKILGFNDMIINKYLSNYDNNIFLDKIRKIITKKVNSNHNYSGNFLKQKIINYLLINGFDINDINKVIKEYDFYDNNNIYLKEYNKLKSKLAKKYNGEELEYQIKSRLYKKGFRNL